MASHLKGRILTASLMLLILPWLDGQALATGSVLNSPGTAPAQFTMSSEPTQRDDGQNGVTVRATWITEEYLRDNGREDEREKYQLDKNLVFYIQMDTHSVNLSDFDVAKSAVLRTEGGELSPNGWTSASDSSHHRSGFLSFPRSASTDDAKYIELVIRDLAGTNERVLHWDR